MALSPQKAQAQSEGTAFSCDGTFYQIRQIGTGATAYSALYVVDRSTAAYSTSVFTFGGTNNTGNLGVVVNALGYNPQDSYLYAITYPADNNATFLNATTGIHLYRIGRGGIRDLGKTNLPLAQYNSGSIDKQGNMYLTTRNSAGQFLNTLFRLKLSDFSTVLTSHDELPLVQPNGTAATADYTDIAYSPTTNKLYGSSELDNLFSIEIVTDAQNVTRAVQTPIASASTSTQILGSNFFDIAGNLYSYSNTGGIYSINLTNGTSTLISSVDAAPNSDGASCINPSERIDVVKEFTGLAVSNNGQTGGNRRTYYDISFAIRVKNTGTTTITNVQVSDFLDNTFGATPYTIQTAPAVTNFSINSGAVPTLAANAAFDGATTDADLLSGNQSLTAGQSALITFTARLTFAGGTPTIPNTIFNNSAYASTTSGTGNQGHIKLSNGTVIPPGNLLAQDQSTNSGGLPLTANGDTPSPTPVRLTAAIQGTVFEDVNYGGGAGRNQPNSSGQGTAARVELYSVVSAGGVDTYTYLNATTTDANGNYIFTTTTGTNNLAANTTYGIRVVNNSVRSTRPGSTSALLPVQTFRTDATTATLAEVTDRVGGEQPDEADYGNGGTGTLPLSGADATQEIQTITKVLTPASGPRVGIDFGFNFDVVVNTNNTGQGSLRQFITNSNTLTNENLAQTSPLAGGTLTAGTEYAVFMLSDGRTTGTALPGLRLGTPAPTTYNATTGVFTFNVTGSTLPTITDNNTAIDGKLQSRLTGEDAAVSATSTGAEIALNFSANPPTTKGVGGLSTTGANTRFASLSLSNAQNSSLDIAGGFASDGSAVTFVLASSAGSIVTDVTTANNAVASVLLLNGATDISVTNNILRTGKASTATASTFAFDGAGILISNSSGNTITGNTISGNAGYGIEFQAAGSAVNDGNTISGNTITGNGASTLQTRDAGISIARGNNNLISANTITGNSGDGIMAMTGTSGNRFSQNNTSGNNGSGVTGNLGIDLSADATINGDGVSLNANGKTASTGANGVLNFPVFTQATISGTNLLVTGYSRTGAVIEFFIASADPTNFGEGATYFATATENTSADVDRRIGTYSGVVGNMGLNQGSETNASRFAFSIPVTAAQITSLTTNKLTATATVPATVDGLNVGNTSEFSGIITVTNNAPLPVELTTFEARAVGQNAQLTWTTASEKNNDHFVVERAYGEQAFTQIATVKGAGTSLQEHSYSFTDAGIGAKNVGTIYYRLKQIDTDGTVNQGPVRTLIFTGEKAADAGVYPNPVVADTKLDLTALPAGSYQVSIVDMTGRTLSTETYAGGIRHPFAVRELTAGSYLVVVRGNNVKLTKRIVKN
ncbi:DUF6923 family protein [Hymenobacter lucidus]|uniref:DUF6923 family protein n=1 Tax=Hymenobacter lucidus TaxID=2880930 RepID=UPI001CF3B7B1|nr:right-handed parallel beta-helix repeat-containing protein [Hymenobacter lucidus]